MYTWYNIGGKIMPVLKRQTGGAVPAAPLAGTQASLVPNSAAQAPWDVYLAGTNPYNIAGGYGVKGTPGQYDIDYTPGTEIVPAVTNTGGGDDGSSGFDDGATKVNTSKIDGFGNPAPYKGRDIYDWEGDDNFLDKDEYQQQVNTITDQYDSWDTGAYDPNRTFEEQLSAEDYEDFKNSSLGENPAQMAADTIYNNNQVIYGEDTGNNLTSLTTGGLTNAGLANTALNIADQLPGPLGDLAKDKQQDNFKKAVATQGDYLADQAGSTKNDDGSFTTNFQSNTSLVKGTPAAAVTQAEKTNLAANTSKIDQAIAAGATVQNGQYKYPDGTVVDFNNIRQVPPTGGGGTPPAPKETGLKSIVSGGGSDGVGNFGKVGDVLGSIGDALGITNYSGKNDTPAPPTPAPTPVTPPPPATTKVGNTNATSLNQSHKGVQAASDVGKSGGTLSDAISAGKAGGLSSTEAALAWQSSKDTSSQDRHDRIKNAEYQADLIKSGGTGELDASGIRTKKQAEDFAKKHGLRYSEDDGVSGLQRTVKDANAKAKLANDPSLLEKAQSATRSKDKAQAFLRELGYGNYDRDSAPDILNAKLRDVNAAVKKGGYTAPAPPQPQAAPPQPVAQAKAAPAKTAAQKQADAKALMAKNTNNAGTVTKSIQDAAADLRAGKIDYVEYLKQTGQYADINKNIYVGSFNEGGPIMGYNTGGYLSPEEEEKKRMMARQSIASTNVQNTPLSPQKSGMAGGGGGPQQPGVLQQVGGALAKKALMSTLGPVGALFGGLFNEGGQVPPVKRNMGGPLNPHGYNEGGHTMETPTKKVMDEQKLEQQAKALS